jgi:hypothetical protein
MIGSLLYLRASRPDIMLSVGMCARYQAALKESQLMAVERVFQYLIHTPTFGLWYPKGSSFLRCTHLGGVSLLRGLETYCSKHLIFLQILVLSSNTKKGEIERTFSYPYCFVC